MTVDTSDGHYEAYYQDGDGTAKLLRAGDGVHMSMNGYIRITKGLAGPDPRHRGCGPQERGGECAVADDQAGSDQRMMLLAAAAALSLGGCSRTRCARPHALDPFSGEASNGSGPGRVGKPVHILQIGDSHTAGDAITGAWRDLLQARYGSGGRGVLAPGPPLSMAISRTALLWRCRPAGRSRPISVPNWSEPVAAARLSPPSA